MSLSEVRKIQKTKDICKLKQYWNASLPEDEFTIPNPTLYMLKTMLKNGVGGVWFHPLNAWVSLSWLKKNNYTPIAERVIYLASLYGDSKRYMVVERISNHNLLLVHTNTDWIKEYIL